MNILWYVVLVEWMVFLAWLLARSGMRSPRWAEVAFKRIERFVAWCLRIQPHRPADDPRRSTTKGSSMTLVNIGTQKATLHVSVGIEEGEPREILSIEYDVHIDAHPTPAGIDLRVDEDQHVDAIAAALEKAAEELRTVKA